MVSVSKDCWTYNFFSSSTLLSWRPSITVDRWAVKSQTYFAAQFVWEVILIVLFCIPLKMFQAIGLYVGHRQLKPRCGLVFIEIHRGFSLQLWCPPLFHVFSSDSTLWRSCSLNAACSKYWRPRPSRFQSRRLGWGRLCQWPRHQWPFLCPRPLRETHFTLQYQRACSITVAVAQACTVATKTADLSFFIKPPCKRSLNVQLMVSYMTLK